MIVDTSLTHRDSEPYFLPEAPPIKPIDFSPHLSATTWMKPLPTPAPPTEKTLVELPCNWYMEDSKSPPLSPFHKPLTRIETATKSPPPLAHSDSPNLPIENTHLILHSDTNAIPARSAQLPRLRNSQ